LTDQAQKTCFWQDRGMSDAVSFSKLLVHIAIVRLQSVFLNMKVSAVIRTHHLLAIISLCGFSALSAFGRNQKVLPGHAPSVLTQLTSKGRLAETNQLRIAFGLPLRDQEGLTKFLRELYDPHSVYFHAFLTPAEFTARFGPTKEDYQAVIGFAERNGLRVVERHSNRLVLDVEGSAANFERAFGVTLRTYAHPTEHRDFFAPDTEPSVPVELPMADMWGITDFYRPIPLSHRADPSKTRPRNYSGSAPGGSYRGQDFRNAYIPGSSLRGAGQTVAVVEFDGYYANDVATYVAGCGYTNVPLQNVLVDGVSGSPGYSGIAGAVAEVSLDIEMAIAIAPGLSKVMVYEGLNPFDVYNRIVTDNEAKQIGSSWAFNRGPTYSWGHPGSKTLDSQLQQMAAQGQSFFQASGDSDAYTGTQSISSSGGPSPVDSIYVTSVGGTTLFMNGAGTSYNSETVWNWGNNTGSGGGVSPNYAIPSWQAGVSMASNNGSTVNRNVPDVALTADDVFVVYNNGSSDVFGGTSCAAPLWAGFTALVNQQSIAAGGTAVGFLNPALYTIANGPNYNSCFHDTTTGNNIGNNTPGLYFAVIGYDLATGLGTPNGTNLINTLAPLAAPYIITQPTNQTVTVGQTAVLRATASGQAPLSYRWLFYGTNLPASGNFSGTATNVLTILSAAISNNGNYQLLVTNNVGSVTSSVAVLTVGSPPVFTAAPTNLTLLAGDTAVFSGTVSGSLPLSYQWLKNGTNLPAGAGITGTTSNVMTLASVTTNSAGQYRLRATNSFGVATSSVATLTVVLPAVITGSSLSNRVVQCASNNLTFFVTASGTPPLSYQWNLDGVPLAGAITTAVSLTNLHIPNHIVSVTVTNLYGSTTSNALITVQDTLAPVITLNGTNPFYLELGSSYVEPGATALDLCMGNLSVSINGSVNTNSLSTNLVTYSAGDGNGNTNTLTRTVIVRDTIAPSITSSFSNLVLAAGSNCNAVMPDVTGTNYILADDLSGSLTFSQTPTNGATLPLGTNLIVITVTDSSGNASYSTNRIVVEDQTPPLISTQPQSQTNSVGSTATFSVTAMACTPLSFQWYSNQSALIEQTNSTLVLSNLTLGAAGDYFALATSAGGSSTSLVATLTVIPRDNSPPSILGVTSVPGGLNLEFGGSAGSTHVLEAATNIVSPISWVPLATNTLDTNGLWQFTDLEVTNFQQRFYRLGLVP
jgi:hypothetical protein